MTAGDKTKYQLILGCVQFFLVLFFVFLVAVFRSEILSHIAFLVVIFFLDGLITMIASKTRVYGLFVTQLVFNILSSLFASILFLTCAPLTGDEYQEVKDIPLSKFFGETLSWTRDMRQFSGVISCAILGGLVSIISVWNSVLDCMIMKKYVKGRSQNDKSVREQPRISQGEHIKATKLKEVCIISHSFNEPEVLKYPSTVETVKN